MPDARACVTLARPWGDGAQALVFTPPELLEKLAAPIPRFRVSPVGYRGVLAPYALARACAVAQAVAA